MIFGSANSISVVHQASGLSFSILHVVLYVDPVFYERLTGRWPSVRFDRVLVCLFQLIGLISVVAFSFAHWYVVFGELWDKLELEMCTVVESYGASG